MLLNETGVEEMKNSALKKDGGGKEKQLKNDYISSKLFANLNAAICIISSIFLTSRVKHKKEKVETNNELYVNSSVEKKEEKELEKKQYPNRENNETALLSVRKVRKAEDSSCLGQPHKCINEVLETKLIPSSFEQIHINNSADVKVKNIGKIQQEKIKKLKRSTYSNRPASRLDHFDNNSAIALSQYRGFANLFSIASIFYVIVNPIIRWYDKNEFIDPSLAKAMFDDFFSLMFMWLKLTLWSFTAYYLHILYMKRKINRLTLTILQHTTQAISIFYTVSHCLYNEWPIIPAGFVQMLAIISFMKMHSFTMTNLDFHDAVDTEEANSHYPQNINLKNFCYYIVCPALVYEPVYPRGPGFRLSYFFWKICSMIGAMMAMYLVCTSCIIPTTINSVKSSFIETYTKLMFPLLTVDMLIFYILFECVCNLFAEITNFGDREFYHDWWNSTTWDEYSRKWNRPVYEFLLRHVYLETLHKLHWSQRDATMATFLFSALIHEMIMGVCFRLIRMYLFLMMLCQIPLIAIGQYCKGSVFGNFIFWGGLMLGVPLLGVAYGREWAQINYLNGESHPLKFF